MLTHRNLVANAMQTAAWFPQGTHGPEKVLGAIPMFHVYGLTAVMLFSIVTGNEVVLYPNPREIGAILKLINKTKPSLFPGVPTMYIAILRHPKLAKYDLRSIRGCISGAAPLPNEVRKQFESATGGRLVEGPPARRRRRTRRARSPGNERVLAQAGGNGHGPPERMVAHGRHRPDGRGRLLLHRRPQEGHDPLLRIQRVSAGGRRGPLHASGRGGSRGHRGAGQVPRRVGQGVRGPEERKGRDAGGNHRILQGAPRGIQGPEIRRVRDRPSDVPRGQGLATAAARARAREVESRRFGLKANGSTEPNRHFGSVEEPTQVLRLVAHRGADGRGERTERFDSNLKSAARALVGPDGRHPAVDKHDRGEPPLWTIYTRVVGTFDEVAVVLLAQEEGVEGWQESDDRNVELRFPQCRKVFAKHPAGLSVDIDGRQLRLQARPDVAGVRGPQSNPEIG